MFKWVLAIAGFFLFKRVFGAFIGFAIGSMVDNYVKAQAFLKNNPEAARNQQNQQRSQSRFSADDFFNLYQRQSQTQNDVPTMLMALSAAVMRADGKVLKAELDYVKQFFTQQFGPQFSGAHLQLLKQFLDSGDIPLNRVTQDIRTRMAPEVRVQLLHYLFGLSKADGHVSDAEIGVIQHIAELLGISNIDFQSVKNMFYRNVNSDYAILGIDPSVTNEEVKKAYRQMAIKFHPDKVSQMGPEFQSGAKEKFQKILDAYEGIKKSRGMV